MRPFDAIRRMVEALKAESALAEQIPVKGLQMAHAKGEPMALGNGPVVERICVRKFEERIAPLSQRLSFCSHTALIGPEVQVRDNWTIVLPILWHRWAAPMLDLWNDAVQSNSGSVAAE
jgi:hypothetical protein